MVKKSQEQKTRSGVTSVKSWEPMAVLSEMEQRMNRFFNEWRPLRQLA